MELSKRAQQVAGSLTLELDGKAKKMKAEGLDVVAFGAGEPDFPTPEHVMKAAHEALDKGMTRYTLSSGTMDLRSAICNKFKRDNNLEYAPNQVVVSNGAKHSIYNALSALVDDGDEVIIPSPFWLSYPEMVTALGGVSVYVQTEEANGFRPTAQSIEAAITPRTKALILNTPSNPTGCVYGEQLLREIADLAVKHDFIVVSDEIYEELVYDGSRHISIASLGEEIYNRTITINGMSKAYAMTGWRIGYLAAPAHIAKAIGNLQSHETSNANAIAQYASIAALEGPREPVQTMCKAFADRRAQLLKRIEETPGVHAATPMGAFYVLLNIGSVFGKSYKGEVVTDSMAFSNLLLQHGLVAAVPGSIFGAPQCVRLSYAIDEASIHKGMDRIADFVKECV